MSRERPPGDDWAFDPALASIDRSLRRELREEAEEVERTVAVSENRGRTLSDIALEARNRGDLIAVATQRRTFQGLLRYAARDFLTVATRTFEVDVNLPAIDHFRIIEAGRKSGGRPMEAGPGTFEMRLMERESPSEQVEIGFRNRDEVLLGRISTVGVDHVVIFDDQKNQWVVPTSSVAFIVRRVNTRMDRR